MKNQRLRRLFTVTTIVGLLLTEFAPAPYYAYAATDDSFEFSTDVFEENIPYDLAGMEPDWTPDAEELALKEDIREHDIAGSVAGLTPGYDYAENEVLLLTDDEAYAREAAEAYKAQLISFHDGVAVIGLDPSVISVSEAVRLGSDPAYNLPAVCPNYKTYITDPEPSGDMIIDKTDELAADGGTYVDNPDWQYWNEQYNDPALDPFFEFAEDPENPEYKKFGFQWMLGNVGCFKAWNMPKRSDENIIVAVIDSGIFAEHEDLEGQVIETYHVISENEADLSGHGTHVAGIVAAKTNNGKGGVGIEPDAKLLNLPVFRIKITSENKVKDDGCSDEDIIAALNYVANNGNRRADIINLSVGTAKYNSAYQKAITNTYEAGVTICAAMGNDGSNNMSYPAAYDHVISVAASDPGNGKTDFSCYGPWADIAAPGCDIFSTWNGHKFNEVKQEGDYTTNRNLYASWDGTSMACPVVAGACAHYMKVYGYTKPDEMERILKSTATRVSDKSIGAGIVNMAAMFPSDNLAPVVSAVDAANKEISLTALTPQSTIYLNPGDGYSCGTTAYIYTLDGKKPAYKNGEATYGTIEVPERESVVGSIKVQDLIDSGLLPSGENVTLNVMRIDLHNKVSKITSVTIKADYAAVDTIEIFGPASIAKGKSAAYSAGIIPSSQKNKDVKWSVSGNLVTVNAKTGKVTVNKNTTDTSFILKAEAGELSKEVTVNIVSPATGVTITPDPKNINNIINEPKKNTKGIYTQLRLFSVRTGDDEALSENQIRLIGEASNGTPVDFTSSAPAIASVDDKGLVTAHRPGKTKITCAATDGSGKKASINIQVIIPASGISIQVKNYQKTIAYGKSATLKAVPGDAFGTPTIKKVDWTLTRIAAYDANDKLIEELSENKIPDSNLNKLVTVKNGKVNVNKKLAQEQVKGVLPSFYEITVKANLTDGSQWNCTRNFMISKPATSICALEVNDEDKYEIINALNIPMQKGSESELNYIWVYADSSKDKITRDDGPEFTNIPVCSSSAPHIVSVNYSRTLKDDEYGVIYEYLISTRERGRATLTFKTVDGTNKKTTVKVAVYDNND